jgi:chemotaxis protein methyltransferase CheR
MELRWKGFRKVRRQVCRRIRNRFQELGIGSFAGYREYLERHAEEWSNLNALCRVTISHFYRDRGLFDYLGDIVLPGFIAEMQAAQTLRVWSAGCASGEEAYTLSLIYLLEMSQIGAKPSLEIIGTDIDEIVLGRAQTACYPASSIKEIPEAWKPLAFSRKSDQYCLQARYRHPVQFLKLDIRKEMPPGQFHLICCRNLVATYFSKELQSDIFSKMHRKLKPNGVLALGSHEELPGGVTGFQRDEDMELVYWKV